MDKTELFKRVQEYADQTGLVIGSQLGFGVHGSVWEGENQAESRFCALILHGPGGRWRYMVIPGRVRNGVVVWDGGKGLPEGMRVTVSCTQRPAVEPSRPKRRVVLPLMPSKRPGTLRLTAERVAELLEDDDLSA